MNRGRRSVFWLALSLPAIFGQTNTKEALPKDVDGWSNVKWGMTLGEARAAAPAETVEVSDI